MAQPTHLVDVGEGLLILHQHLGEGGSLVRVHPHHLAQQQHVVRHIAHLLSIEHYLLELPGLRKALDHL